MPVPLELENIPALKDEVRALAEERSAVILAHNYQVPEVQEVAHFVGDSLGLSRKAAETDAEVIAFCGVHFMAETASILSPDKTVLLPDLDAGCSLADSITADELRAWKAKHPGALVVMYVNTTAEVKAETDYCCTSSNAVQVVEHIWREHGEDTEILFGPDMWLGAYVERVTGRRLNVWTGECHVHAGIRPGDIADVRDEHPDAEFLIHPECGCTTQVMEYVASGDVDPEHTHMLSTGGMLRFAGESDAEEFIVATETGMLYPLEAENPGKRFIAANRAAVCRYMKMITLPKLRDALRELKPQVKVDPAIAERARVPIERMVAITP
jgi:quinolinate synthase